MAPLITAYNWTGFYVGLNAGGIFSNDGLITELAPSLPNDGVYNATGDVFPLKSRGSLTGGLQVGYNYEINPFVVGLEADINALRYKVMAPEQTTAGVISSGGDTLGSKKANWLSTIRLRLGFTPIDRLLIFATAGVAFSDLKYSVVDACNTGGCGGGLASGSTSVNTGWAAGGGLEYAFTQNWTVKGEYLYSRFAAKTFRTVDNGGPTTTPFDANHTGLHMFRVGLNYKF